MLSILPLGTGRGADAVLQGTCSSSFVVVRSSKPVLLFDVGFGVMRSFSRFYRESLPAIYVSHNHSDHAAELPVLGALAAAKGRKLRLIAENDVLDTLKQHRLDELRSTGRPLSDYFDFEPVTEAKRHTVTSTLSIEPVRAHHSERAFGFLLYDGERPVLGVSSDSRADDDLYDKLAAAPTLLLDGREQGNAEHASLTDLEEWAARNLASRVYVTGYGETGYEASHFSLARIGELISLGP